MDREVTSLPLERVPEHALVCALDWGLGHVARTSVVVRRLLDAGSRVTLASNGRSADWWRAEFPELPLRELPDYAVSYANGVWLVPGLLASLPRLRRAIRQENRLLESWQGEGFDLVLSDNRYGCRIGGVKSVLLTHQLRLAAPRRLRAFEGIGERLMARMVRGFDEVWIPDHAENGGLSGRLGHPVSPASFPPLRYVGPLSRMAGVGSDARWNGPWGLVVLVSGPEPGRTRLETAARKAFGARPGRSLLVRGRPDLPSVRLDDPPGGGWMEIPHLATPALAAVLSRARFILSRGGYSTVMDLDALGVLDNRCLWCPTPGQTEQEALVEALVQSGRGRLVSEHALDEISLDS